VSALDEGSVIEIDADDAAGHEQRGRRPALVVSVSVFQQDLGMAVVCPITTHGGTAQKARNALEIALPPGLPVSGAILAYHLRTIDLKARNARELGKVPRATLLTVRARLKALLGL
jgi:mRNA interferase MazF